MPKVSVVMPSLNVAGYIRECIESVINQTLKDIEILCVDAGSTDGTLEVIKEYEKKDQRVRVMLSEKRSYGFQVNMGFREAKGEYFAIVETDDYIQPKMYERLTSLADKYDLDTAKADYAQFTGEGDTRSKIRRPIVRDRALYGKVIDPNDSPETCNLINVYTWAGIYRTSFLRENEICHNESPGASYQDNGFWFQTTTMARRVMFLNEPFYMLRRDNPSSSFHSREKVYAMKDEYDFIRKWLAKHPDHETRFKYLCAYRRFENYLHTAKRIGDEYKREFLNHFADEFNQLEKSGEIQRSYFSDRMWYSLRAITDSPEAYYFCRLYHPKDEGVYRILHLKEERLKEKNLELKKENDRMKHSLSYRIGRLAAFFPRKLFGRVKAHL